MRQSKAITVFVGAAVIALFAMTCLPSAPAYAGGALVPGTPAYNVLAQKSTTLANQNWHLISTDTYCWTRTKPHFLYTYEYGASESFLIIENIEAEQTTTWRWTPATGWYIV